MIHSSLLNPKMRVSFGKVGTRLSKNELKRQGYRQVQGETVYSYKTVAGKEKMVLMPKNYYVSKDQHTLLGIVRTKDKGRFIGDIQKRTSGKWGRSKSY